MDSIIFDVDGTLWDSTGITADAWTKYLQNEEHINMTITAELLQSVFGQLLSDIARQFFPDLNDTDRERVITNCCEAEHQALLKTCAPLYEDLEDTLRILSKRFPLFIVSNCQAGYIEVFLEATGFGHYFKGHLCPGDTGMAKAENIMKIVETYQLKSPIYVGDTNGDYQACLKAGVPFIFASYGFGHVETPDHTIYKPMDLIEICI